MFYGKNTKFVPTPVLGDYPSLKQANEFFNNIERGCSCHKPFVTTAIADGYVRGKCYNWGKVYGCRDEYTATFEEVNRFTNMNRARYDNMAVYWDGKKVKSWKANPDPFRPAVPRLHLTFEDNSRTNLTGSDSSLVWELIKKQDEERQRTARNSAKVDDALREDWSGVDKTYDTKRYAKPTQVRDPNFEKIKNWKPGQPLSLRKYTYKLGDSVEEMDFVVDHISQSEAAAYLCPVSGGLIGGPIKFTAETLSKLNVGTAGASTCAGAYKKQGKQLLDHGPKVYCENQYE